MLAENQPEFYTEQVDTTKVQFRKYNSDKVLIL